MNTLFSIKPTPNGSSLIRALSGLGWVKGPRLAEIMGISERQIRAEAEASNWQVIGGPKGYCLLSEATLEEVKHHINSLKSRARKLNKRAIATENHLHQRIAK